MRFWLFSLAVLFLLVSCRDVDSGSARRIAVEGLHEALDAGQAVVVDVRSEEAYEAGHIEGAVSMPLPEIEERSTELPLDKLIVTYCS